jgi:predicted metal-dependent TIM-barrel fold hydrolase
MLMRKTGTAKEAAMMKALFHSWISFVLDSASRIALTFDPSTIGIRSIVEVIEAAGYNALIVDSGD